MKVKRGRILAVLIMVLMLVLLCVLIYGMVQTGALEALPVYGRPPRTIRL